MGVALVYEMRPRLQPKKLLVINITAKDVIYALYITNKTKLFSFN